MDIKDIKKILKKTWYLIWKSDSIWSWLVNVLLAFLIIKFIVYPGLGFFLETTHPIVAVVSSSMEHDGSFNQWWASSASCKEGLCTQSAFYSEFDITKEQFLEFKFKDGFNKGDIIVLKSRDPEKINVGDVIVFRSITSDPIIHRVIRKWQQNNVYYFQTKGDHNSQSVKSASLDETKISQDAVIGKAVLRIRYLGWIKIAFVGLLKLISIPQ